MRAMTYAKALVVMSVLSWSSLLVDSSSWDGITPWFSDSSCNCNGFSTRCFFDRKLYEQTGHGGHCMDCAGYRDGPNCERCKDNYYQHQDSYCAPCNCDPMGSRSLQCNREGQCQCKPGVTGIKCDRCASNYYEFSSDGCKPCNCNTAGSLGNSPQCDPISGACLCKENVEGKHCGNCKLGFFNLDLENEFGCNPCFCYGHSSQCSSAPGYSKVDIQSSFSRGAERWTGRDLQLRSLPVDVDLGQAISLTSSSGAPLYFNAPERFLGDQRASYNQLLTFKLRTTDSGPSPSVEDIVLEGAGLTITQTIFGQKNPLPGTQFQLYSFRLHDNHKFGWQPRLSSRDFISVLANLTAIRIRATYTHGGSGYLDDVHLVTARIGAAGLPASWVENCECLNGYIGQFCESCMPGFRHDPPSGGPFSPCIPCNCNGHADICDAETGRCICQDNTSGDNCERCARGYYGNALQGSPDDCQRCNCPLDGPCIQLPDSTLVCLECPKGYGGPRCEVCSDGYFGDPLGTHGPKRPCVPCDCNTNVDPNAVGNCNRTTGECLKCIYNTAGSSCDQCKPGYYGDPLAPLKGDCRQCQCYEPGTLGSENGSPHCDQVTGQCRCRPHVQGRNCDTCQDGYFNIASGEGCQACNCDSIGSINNTCDQRTGQCQCRQGVVGLRCDVCLVYQYGFSLEGCRPCDCDPIGSISLQCDPLGQCPCQENVEGRRCDRCKENKFDRQRGCIDCPACYDLVQAAANKHRDRLSELHRLLDNISTNPTVISDDRFEQELNYIQKAVEELWSKTKERAGDNGESPSDRLRELYNRIEAVNELDAERNILLNGAYISSNLAFENMTLAEATLKEAEDIFKKALDDLQTRGEDALKNAQERSKQFGQQNDQMAEIARSARKMAEEQEEESEAIKKLADDALNTTIEAFNLANKTLEQQQQIEKDMESLVMQLEDSANQLSMTQKLAFGTQEMVKEVLDEAFANYFEVDALTPPETNASDIRTEAQQAQEEANRIKTEAQELLSKHEQLQDDLERQIANTETLLDRGTRQQQLTDELLADVDAAKSKAEDAVKLGDTTLATAQDTLDTLQKFDKQVQDSKTKAKKSLEEVPEIRQLISLAENKTSEARKALEGAEMNADKAEKLANEAHELYAKNASLAAAEIVEAAEKTKTQANELRDLADNQASRVVATSKQLKEHEDKAEQEETLISEAKEKVGQAKTDATEAAKQVAKALEEVQEIKRILEELPNLSADGLDDLERRLEAAQQEFAAANLDDRIEQIRGARLEQTKAINEYKDQLDLLEREVENIEAIYNSLPDGCWKRIILEP